MYCPHCGSDRLIKDGSWSNTEGKRLQKYRCNSCRGTTTTPLQAPRVEVEFQQKLKPADIYVFSSCQNATPIHQGFWRALQAYCDHRGAQLYVIPFRYKNPTSRWTAAQEDSEWWADEVHDHLFDGRVAFNENLMIMGDIKVVPTSSEPLRGYESISGEKSAIFGHPKIQLRTVATPSHRYPKIITTTGAVTVENYTDSNSGKKGAFHHSFGAVVVEKGEGGLFFMRHISALKNGSFIDLNEKFTEDGTIEDVPRAAALVMGDTHVDFVDPDVVKATFLGPNSMVEFLNPHRLVWHDLLDMHSRNYWHSKDPFQEIGKLTVGGNHVRNEVVRACEFLSRHGQGRENIVVPSNHVERLTAYIKETDWRKDPHNAEFYLETALHMTRSTKMTDSGVTYDDPFHYWAKKTLSEPFKKTLRLLQPDQSYEHLGTEFTYHGDIGPNGARGSIRNLKRIGVKTFIAHSHIPGIEEGCMQVGTSTRLRLDYNKGPSGWMNTHGVQYVNGKRALLHMFGGEWKRNAATNRDNRKGGSR